MFLINVLELTLVLDKIHWIRKENQLAGSLTKIGGDVSPQINTLIYGKLYDPE